MPGDRPVDPARKAMRLLQTRRLASENRLQRAGLIKKTNLSPSFPSTRPINEGAIGVNASYVNKA